MNPKADSEEIAKFKAGLFAKFKTAIINDEEILFLDETHVQQGNKNYGYAPQGEKAIYETNGGTLHCHYSLLSIIGFNFVMIIKVKGTVTSEIYKKALIKLRRIYPKRKFLIFRDNAVIHRSKEINKYIKGSAGKFLRFEPLPRYCPEFNPVELLNNEYKKFILKAICRTEEDVLVMTKEFLGQFQNKKGKSSNSGRRKTRQYFKGKNTKFIYNAQIEAMKAVMREKRLKRALQRKVA